MYLKRQEGNESESEEDETNKELMQSIQIRK
jgi:hypothetical protein